MTIGNIAITDKLEQVNCMIDLGAIFKNKQLDKDKLPSNGFIFTGEDYIREYVIMQGQFIAEISVSVDGKVTFLVLDTETKEEYVLAKNLNATGTFVGEVHKACEEILVNLSQKCFHTEYFKSAQAKRILQYIKEQYHAQPEFLWSSLPECAALRVPGKKPWFGVVGRVEKSKFNLTEAGTVEVINLKNEPKDVAAFIKEQRAFPAYHMNKKCWYSIFLDDSLSDDEIISLINISYALVNS